MQQVILTQQHAFGPVNLIIDWNAKEEAPRYWVLDQPADRHAWRRGRKRFWIEPTNRDLKSAGFDLECSALPDPARLSKLVLAMAGLSRAFADHGPERCNTRNRSKSNLARPYICRLICFKRFTWPSTCPWLQG